MNMMIHPFMLKTVTVSFALAFSSGYADVCPTPPTSILPRLKVNVKHEPGSGLYTYSYTLTNANGAGTAISTLAIPMQTKPESTSIPPQWLSRFRAEEGSASYFFWGASPLGVIAPGSTVEGFSITSKLSPGPIRYFTDGETTSRIATPTEEDDEPSADCEGFYDDKSTLDSMVSGVTQGPVGDLQVSLEIALKDRNGDRDCGPIFPYEEKGTLHLFVKSKKDIDAKNIDLSSLRFGVGQAPVLSSRFIGKDQHLFLDFDLKTAEVECGRDRVLFLSGKMKDGRPIFGAAEVKTKNCDRRPKRKPLKHPKRPARS